MARAFVLLAIVLCVVPGQAGQSPNIASPAATSLHVPSTYDLGPGDVVQFYGVDADEIVNKPYRISLDGDISLPLIGRIRVGWLTIGELENLVNGKLQTFIKRPQLVANVVEFRSQPVSVVGAVNQSGTQQLQGRKTLLEMVSLAGGLRPEAGYKISITRQIEWGELDLSSAYIDSTGKYSIAEVNIRDLLAGQRPTDNIQIMPNDVITVPKAEMVFVLGDVQRSGAHPLVDRQSMSIIEAVSVSEGLSRTADAKHSHILRTVPGQAERLDIPVNIKSILAGSADDVSLQPGDILFVPGSVSKMVGLRGVEAIVQVATGLAVWGPLH